MSDQFITEPDVCEMNYIPARPADSIDMSKALQVNV
jgi:hypothetical protein